MQDKVVRANLTRMIREERLFDKRDHVLVAVSGGQDSLHVLRWLTDNSLPADIQPPECGIHQSSIAYGCGCRASLSRTRICANT